MTTLTPQPHVGDIGLKIRPRVVANGLEYDISTATTKQIVLKKPSGALVTLTAAFTASNGVDGVLEYTTQAADLDESGPWIGQVYIVMPNRSFRTTPFSFSVAANLV